jgi:hypothetical protein
MRSIEAASPPKHKSGHAAGLAAGKKPLGNKERFSYFSRARM